MIEFYVFLAVYAFFTALSWGADRRTRQAMAKDVRARDAFLKELAARNAQLRRENECADALHATLRSILASMRAEVRQHGRDAVRITMTLRNNDLLVFASESSPSSETAR